MTRINSAIRSLTLRTRIFVSTGLLLAGCCLTAGIAWVGQNTLLKNFQDYERAELVSSRVLEVDRNVQELKAVFENHIQSGSDSTRRSAERLLKNLLGQIQETQQLTAHPELVNLLGDMALHLETFGEQLGLAARERGIRTALVDEQLPEKALAVKIAMEGLAASIESDASLNTLHEVAKAFSDGQEQLLRYLLAPDADRLDRMLAALKKAERQLDSLQQDEVDRGALEELSHRFVEFRLLSLRAVQATRGYLYYANVVMAGEISEFVYYSNQVKKLVEAERQGNRIARRQAAHRARSLSVTVSLIAVLFAGFLATGLSYSIVQPLSLLTHAFHRLAGGETLEEIPGTERSDELGEMAAAAQVFSAKNQETQELLTRAQTLSAELATKAQALEETNRELDNFAYVASHDLKAPLRGIRSVSQWVIEDCQSVLPEDSRRHLKQLQDRVQKMDRLLEDLLEYSRVGRIGQQAEVVELDDMVRSLIEMVDNPDGVTIQIDTPLPRIFTSATPLKQVILNLLTNAIKYNDKGRQGMISLSCENAGSHFTFTVADNGMGIEPRYHERVFQMYQRVAPQAIEGSGMGLAIVKKQVEYFGGSVTLKSETGRGTTLKFSWPCQPVPAKGDHPVDPCECVDAVGAV